jgi:hypothetical protein
MDVGLRTAPTSPWHIGNVRPGTWRGSASCAKADEGSGSSAARPQRQSVDTYGSPGWRKTANTTRKRPEPGGRGPAEDLKGLHQQIPPEPTKIELADLTYVPGPNGAGMTACWSRWNAARTAHGPSSNMPSTSRPGAVDNARRGTLSVGPRASHRGVSIRANRRQISSRYEFFGDGRTNGV